MCCRGFTLTSIMMSWIIQIGLFSLLSLRWLIYAWVPRGRLQLSFLCLYLWLPVVGNKPMIINQSQDPPPSKFEIQIIPDLLFHRSVFHCYKNVHFFCVSCSASSTWNEFALFHTHVLVGSTALTHSVIPTAIKKLYYQNLFVWHLFYASCFVLLVYFISCSACLWIY